MKLWQKIFILALLFVVFSVEAVTLLVLSGNFNRALQRQTLLAVREHNYIGASISNNLVYERLRQGKVVLPPQQTTQMIADMARRQFSVNRLTIYREDWAVCSSRPTPDSLDDFRQAVMDSEEVLSYIGDFDEGTFLLVGAKASFEHELYTVYTATDLTELYRTHTAEMRSASLAAMVLALVAAGALLAVVYTLLAPLRKTNQLLGEIAGGNYSLRLPEKGGYEFRELARNINAMAQATEENVRSLENTAESRKRLIDNFAHEMKTPLTSILGFSDLLRVKKHVSEAERREYAGIVVEETRRLRNLSGKLLQLATSDHVSLEFEQVNVTELFREIHIAVLPMLSKQHLHLSCTPLDLPLYIDRELFKSLLYNLIDNAAKASKPGGAVALVCRLQEGRPTISVQDSGVGISPEQLAHITEPFYMADKSRSRKEGGVGLGLSLCLEIAKQHGARLKISSALGQGTLVTITMKGAPPHEST